MSGPGFWFIWLSGLAVGAAIVAVWFGLALWATRRVTLRDLFDDWANDRTPR